MIEYIYNALNDVMKYDLYTSPYGAVSYNLDGDSIILEGDSCSITEALNLLYQYCRDMDFDFMTFAEVRMSYGHCEIICHEH